MTTAKPKTVKPKAAKPNASTTINPNAPRLSLLDPEFKYIPAARTNILNTWRKYGWVPPSETNAY